MRKEVQKKKISPLWLAACLLPLAAGLFWLAAAPGAGAHQGVIGHGFSVTPELDWDGENEILAVKLRLSDAEHKVGDYVFEFGWTRYQAENGISCQVDDFSLDDNLEAALAERGFGEEAYEAQKDVYYSNNLGGLLDEDEIGAYISVRDVLTLMDEETRGRFIDGAERLGVCFLLRTEGEHLILKELVLGAAQIRSGSIADLAEDEVQPAEGEPIAVGKVENQTPAELAGPAAADENSEEEDEAGATSLILLGAVLIVIGAATGIIFFLAARKQKEDLPPMY